MTHSAENDAPAPVAGVSEEEGAVQVVMTAPTFDWFQREVRARGLYLFTIPLDGADDLRTLSVSVGLMGHVIPPGSNQSPDERERQS